MISDYAEEQRLVAAKEALERPSEALWQQREQFRVTLASIGDGVITTDTHANVTFMNPVAEAMTGWSQHDALGRPLEDVFRIVHEETGAAVSNPVNEVLRTGTAVGLAQDTALIRKDGASLAIEHNAAPIRDMGGNLFACVMVFHDITQRRRDLTERRQAEELRGRLAAVIESSTDAVVSKTLESLITTWNHGAERLFGYKAEEVIGKPITIIIPPDQAHEEPAILERIKTGQPVEPFQTIRRRKDGTLVNVSLAVSPIRDSQGRIIGASKIARDITAEKRAETVLRETDRRKDEFLATLAHELRNPLAPIRQATLIAQSPNATEAQKRWSHDVIIRQVHNMALLLDDLLDISRITRGTLALRTQPTDLGTIIAAAVETARPLIDAKRHTLSVQLPTERVEFAADPMRLAQVLSNLLTNAAKYTDPDGSIGLAASCDGDVVTIGVTDTGIGIPPDAMGNLFGMFSQVKSGKDRSEGGLGIGLALAKGLVELHGGTIEARSAGTERGSEFIIRLPRRAQRVSQATPQTRPGPERALRRRVLIADDNRDAAESLAMLLQMEGHEVTVVHDGREAVTAFEKVRPDAALLDIGMPGLNGYEIARIIRRAPHGRDVTLVAVTGWGQESDKAQATDAGFNHHFTKPVEPDAITALLARPAASPK